MPAAAGQGLARVPYVLLLLISVWQAGFTCSLLLLMSGCQVGFTCTESTPGFHVAAALIRAQPMSRSAGQGLSGRGMLCYATVATLLPTSDCPDLPGWLRVEAFCWCSVGLSTCSR